MEKQLCLFSSDYRPLYKADVFAALALPKDSILHFRYQPRWIGSEYIANIKSVEGKMAIVFYANVIEENGQKTDRYNFVSVRKVIIKNAEFDEDTQQVHLYLEMKDFCDANIIEQNKNLMPPHRFLSDVSIEMKEGKGWIERVRAVKEYFGNVLYFHIRTITENGNNVKPVYNSDNNEVYYKIHEESEYHLDTVMADFSGGDYKIKFEANPSLLSLDIPDDFALGSEADLRKFYLLTHTLAKSKVPAFIWSKSLKEGDSPTYGIKLRLLMQRKKRKPFLFGAFSALAFIGIFIGQILSKNKKLVDAASCFGNFQIMVSILLGIIFIFGSAALLYHFFDKK